MKLFNLLKKEGGADVEEISQEEYDWRTEQFKVINIIQSQNGVTKCKVADVKEKGIMVKVENLYAYLPFQLTPWQYPNKDYWHTIKNSLKNHYFDCKIVSAEQIEEGKYKIFVDASIHKFSEFELKKDVKYKGIVLKMTQNGYFVDIGVYSGWRFGTIMGFLNKSKYYSDEFTENYKEGDVIDVYFWDKSPRGIDFVNGKFYDIFKKYTGLRVSVRVNRTDGITKLLVEDKFDAFCADKVTEYIVADRNNGELVECEIVGYDTQKGFAVRHAYHDSVEHIKSWNSFILEKYIGRADLVEKEKQYRGIVVKKFNNGVFVDIGGCFDWDNGSVIGRLGKEHFDTIEHFDNVRIGEEIKVIYNVSVVANGLEFWEANYFEACNRYTGKIVPVSVYIIADTLTLLLEDRYKATVQKRKGEKNIIFHHKNGDTIFCEVVDYTPYRGYVVQYVLEERENDV